MSSLLPRTFWVEPARFLAGAYPYHHDPEEGRPKLQTLLDLGIRSWLSLQEENEPGYGGLLFPGYEPVLRELAEPGGLPTDFRRIPIPDMGVCSPETMVRILDHLDAALAADRPIYLHCWGGHGRTGTVIACWLVRHGRSGRDALARLTELRSRDDYMRKKEAPQTSAQRALVRDWADFDPALRLS